MTNIKTKREVYKEIGEGNSFLLTNYTEDYALYVKNQKILNDRKFGPGCNDSPLQFQKMKEIVLKRIDTPTFGLCHGVRSGLENKTLGEQLGCTVIGTEIGDKFGNKDITIQWDMHDVKDEWIGKCDVIYSNSFDHSYDPIYCAKQWASCLKKTGIIVLQLIEEVPGINGGHHIQRAIDSKTYSPGDPFNVPLSVLKNIIEEHTPLEIHSVNNWWANKKHVRHVILQLKK